MHVDLIPLLLLFNLHYVTYTAISRKVVRKNVHATIPKGNMGYDKYTVPDTVAVEPTFFAFLEHSQTYDQPLVSFIQISLKNSALKTTQNTCRDCRVHFLQIALYRNTKFLKKLNIHSFV